MANVECGGLIPGLTLLKMRELQRLRGPVNWLTLLDQLQEIRRLIVVESLAVKGAVHKGIQDLGYSSNYKCLDRLRIRVGRDGQTKLLAEGLFCSLAALRADHPTRLVRLDTQLLCDISQMTKVVKIVSSASVLKTLNFCSERCETLFECVGLFKRILEVSLKLTSSDQTDRLFTHLAEIFRNNNTFNCSWVQKDCHFVLFVVCTLFTGGSSFNFFEISVGLPTVRY